MTAIRDQLRHSLATEIAPAFAPEVTCSGSSISSLRENRDRRGGL